MSRGISILGSTGSIGTQALEVVRAFPGAYRVVSLAAGKNIDLLRKQIAEFEPEIVSVCDPEHAKTLHAEFPETQVLFGFDGIDAALEAPGIDVVLSAIVGFAGLAPTLKAVKLRKTVALANKESLVVAGPLLKEEARKYGATLIPVDSEHNALFQLLQGRPSSDVEKLILTASGGPLLKMPDFPLEDVTPELAIRHPNWAMGPKISVDSATLMNKGLELIEASYLFGLPSERIDVWVHPQSIVHGALLMKDGSYLAQLSRPDMRFSIGFALQYPQRLSRVAPELSWKEMQNLTFLEPDYVRFPALSIARHALKSGPSYCVALNAANEVAVDAFLKCKILFPQITQVIEKALHGHVPVTLESVHDIVTLDGAARGSSRAIIDELAH